MSGGIFQLYANNGRQDYDYISAMALLNRRMLDVHRIQQRYRWDRCCELRKEIMDIGDIINLKNCDDKFIMRQPYKFK